MGFKLSLILGALLVASLAGSSYLFNQLTQAKANQIVLTDKISEQNNSIKQYLVKQEQLFAVSGCSLLPVRPVEVNTIALPAPMYHPPLPIEIQAVDVKFEVLTPELMEEYLKLVKDGKAPAVAYYALTTKEYENLSMNMAEITRYTKNILAIIQYYRDYDKESDD